MQIELIENNDQGETVFSVTRGRKNRIYISKEGILMKFTPGYDRMISPVYEVEIRKWFGSRQKLASIVAGLKPQEMPTFADEDIAA